MSKQEEQVSQEQAVPAVEPAADPSQQPAELTVQDLQAIKAIIDVASQRGAFKPNEMMTVGQVYTKLEVFLGSVAQQQGSQAKGE